MFTRIEATRAMLEDTAWRLDHAPAGDAATVASVCMAKNFATRTLQFCADAAVQTLGGTGALKLGADVITTIRGLGYSLDESALS